jgi:hypothetical protein
LDDRAFDSTTRRLGAGATRRSAVAAALAGLGLAAAPVADVAGKRRRCKPKPKATVCQGKCGVVRNNCGKRVECGGDVCASGCEFTTVQAAVNNRPAGSTIRVCAGTFGGRVTIAKDITLVGLGDGDNDATNTILDGGNNGPVVTIDDSATVTLRDLRITGGLTNGNGGGIFNDGSILTVEDCTIAGNEASGIGNSGGGVFHLSGTTTLTRCIVVDNKAGGFGGGVYGGEGTLALTACTLSNNRSARFGGALNGNGSVAIQVEGGTIGPDNEAEAGAVMAGNGAAIILNGVAVTGNAGIDQDKAGGVYAILGGQITLAGTTTVANNTPFNCGGTIFGDSRCDD